MAEELNKEQDRRLERPQESEPISRIERKVLPDENEELENIQATEDEKNKKKPELWVAAIFILIALALDIFSAIPGLNDGTDGIADAIFIPLFLFIGKGFNAKKITSFGVMTIIEAIPGVSFLPMISINVIYCLYFAD